MLKQIPKNAVYAILFLVPLFSLPFTSNALDFQKQFLLFIIASIGLVCWAWSAVNEKKLDINLNPLHFFVGAFVAVAFVSSIFSLYRYGSLWGWPLPVSESFIALLSMVFMYFLIVNNFKKNDLHKPIAILAVSATIAAVYAVIQSFGEKLGFYLLPFLEYTKDPSFNTIGTTNAMLIFAAIVLAMIFPLAFISKSKYSRLLKICSITIYLTLIFFNGIVTVYFPVKSSMGAYDLSIVPWLSLAVSALAVFVFSISDQKFLHRNINAKNASFALLLVTILFLVFNVFAKPMVAKTYGEVGASVGVSAAREAVLQQPTSADIAVSTLKQSAQHFLLGSGPGTFNYDYVKFKPEKINRDDIGWQLTFQAASSEFLNRVATTGLLGIIALLLIVVAWTIEGFRMLTEEDNEVGLPLAIFAGWVATVVALFWYPFNLSLLMLFWFFLAAIVVMDEKRMVLLPLRSVKMNYAVSLAFVALVALEMGLLVWNAKHYYAEVEYLGAIRALQAKDIVSAISKLESAADATDRLQDNYLTGLSQIYLEQANAEASKNSDSGNEAAIQAAMPYLENAVAAAQQSTDAANPNSSTNWASRGYIYRSLIGYDKQFDAWAVDMYSKALQLEPTNPVLWNEIGQVYVLTNDLDKAKESFTKATDIRPRYVDPHYYLALIHDRQGNKEAAIAELQNILAIMTSSGVDQKEIDNIDKAIENLKEGKSLTGQAAEASQNTTPQVPSTEIPQTEDIGKEKGETPAETPAEEGFGVPGPVPAGEVTPSDGGESNNPVAP